MKNRIWSVIFLGLIYQNLWAGTGSLFSIMGSGTPAEVNITLCLNAKGPVSCQNYHVSAVNLSILTKTPNHTYPFAGIKINTPYYSIANVGLNCTLLSNGFCMFSVSNVSPAMIHMAQFCLKN
ncbi:hypothetical protein [Legionella tucsonensis]|uniref:Secreted protein n=1 Tax=Legionella tucsonensis TaxID=40335 RepID=A0A0W0ZPT3_9GAMM|nr:hypothetical protein [Legionella tucsonensis]KTD70803.1 secreted protein [Legionella tucsonensis]